MSHFIKLNPLSILFSLVFLFISAHSVAAWEPTFVDNFNGNEVRKDAWRPGWSHIARRINFYDEDALRVEDGVLNIEVLDRPEGDRGYTTGFMSTQGLFKQKYGYFEMRARVPEGNGFWPAFWLMPSSGKWTSEIDIAEFRGHTPSSYIGAFHFKGRQRNENTGNMEAGVDITKTFNNYALRWTPNRLEYLFNGEVLHTVDRYDTVKEASSEMFVILNLAIASQHVGWIPAADRYTDMSKSFEVDYVRVYKQSSSGRYSKIPEPSAHLEDLIPPAYDLTALSVNRIKMTGQNDLLRELEPIKGKFELTSHKKNYSGKVLVYLTQLKDFNDSDGYYGKTSALEAREFWVDLKDIGDSTVIEYSFDHGISTPGVYSIDVLVKDPTTGEKYLFGAARIVQFIDEDNPNLGSFFHGFICDVSSKYQGQKVSGKVEVQLQQALLVPYVEVTTSIIDDSDRVITQSSVDYEHEHVGLIEIPYTLSAKLNNKQSYTVETTVSDPRGRVLDKVTSSLGGGLLSVPAAPGGAGMAPVTPTNNMESNESPQVIDNGSTGGNRLNTITFNEQQISLQATLNNISQNDVLLYNVKILRGYSAVDKFTGSAGKGFKPGMVTIPIDVGVAPKKGSYTVVVFVHKNRWGNEILRSTTHVTID